MKRRAAVVANLPLCLSLIHRHDMTCLTNIDLLFASRLRLLEVEVCFDDDDYQ